MALFPEVTEVKPILFGSSVSTTLTTAVQPNAATLVIPRQSRRLKTLFLHANCTIASNASPPAARDGLENIFQDLRLVVSDKAGSTRTARKFNSATAIAWHRRVVGRSGRFTQAAFSKEANGTYDLIVPIHISDPSLGETAAVRTSLPLWSGASGADGVGEDVRLELALNNEASVGAEAAATVTINYLHAMQVFIEAAEQVSYVPTETLTNSREWGSAGGELQYEFPEKGWLASVLHEGFTSSTARGDVQSSGQAFWQLFYGRSQRMVFTTKLAQELDGYWMNEYPNDESTVNDVNDIGVWMLDLVNSSYGPQSLGAGALPNLYLSNNGDRAYIKGTSISANATSFFTTHKYLVNDLAALSGI